MRLFCNKYINVLSITDARICLVLLFLVFVLFPFKFFSAYILVALVIEYFFIYINN